MEVFLWMVSCGDSKFYFCFITGRSAKLKASCLLVYKNYNLNITIVYISLYIYIYSLQLYPPNSY